MLASELPLKSYRVSRGGAYGAVRSPTVTHYGVDYAPTDLGEYVVAPETSVVRYVTRDDGAPLTGYGPGAVLLDGLGVYHVLGHLDAGDLAGCYVGRVYRCGERVARVARSLRAPHLHHEVRTTMLPPRGADRARHTLHPALWHAWRRTVETGAALALLAFARGAIR